MNFDLSRQIHWKWLAATWLGLVVLLVLIGVTSGHGVGAFGGALREDTLYGLLPWAIWRAWEVHHDPDGFAWRRWDVAVVAAGTLITWGIPLAVLAVGMFRHFRGTAPQGGEPGASRSPCWRACNRPRGIPPPAILCAGPRSAARADRLWQDLARDGTGDL